MRDFSVIELVRQYVRIDSTAEMSRNPADPQKKLMKTYPPANPTETGLN